MAASHVTLGDPVKTQGSGFPTIGEAVVWLWDHVCAHYPEREFARKYCGSV
jgi:hypothetical protein